MIPEKNEQQDIIKDMASFLKRTTKIHILKYLEEQSSDKAYWRLALSTSFVSMPRKEKGLEEVFQIWGNPFISSIDRKTSKDTCEETALMLAHIFLVQGYEVFIDNEEFCPFDGE